MAHTLLHLQNTAEALDWLRQQGLAEPEKESKLKRLAKRVLRKITPKKKASQ